MALTITIDGKGSIAVAKKTAPESETWGEQGSTLGVVDETDIFLQGTSAVSTKASGKAGWLYFDIGAGNELDFGASGTEEDQLLYLWFNLTTVGGLGTLANRSLAIQVGTSTTDADYWTIMGSDGNGNGYTGGWMCAVIDISNVAATGSVGAGLTLSSARYFGVYIDNTGSAKAENLIIDQIMVGNGLRIINTSVSEGWQEVSDYCNDFANRAWGMFQEREGIFYLYGNMYIGDSGQTAVTTFADSAKVLRFGDFQYWTGSVWATAIGDGHNGIVIEDASTYATTFQDGIAVGTDAGRSGSVFIGAGSIDTIFDLYGGSEATSLTTLYASQLLDIDGGITFGNDSDHKVFSVTFQGCAQVDPVGAPQFRNCLFVNTVSPSAALLWNSSIDVQACKFIANTTGAGVEHDTEGSFSHVNLTYDGNTYDVENSTSATQVDAYPDTNRDTTVQLYSGSIERIAQSFVATAGELSRAIFSLQTAGSPSGNVVAKLYSDSGGSGPSAVLATSEDVAITGIGAAWAQVDFEFEDEYTLVAATTYWISVEYAGGDSSNRLEVGVDNSTPTHSGTCYTYSGSWGSQTYDLCFYVNRDGIVTVNASAGADPTSAEESAAVKGATIIVNTKTLTVETKNSAGLAIEGVRVRIETDPGGVLISEGTTNASGIYTDATYNYGGDTDVKVVARLKGYKNNAAFSEITTAGLSVPFTMIRDPAVNLP